MASAANIPASALIVALVGSVLAYSAVKGKSFSGAARALLSGQSPGTAAETLGISTPTTADTGLPAAGSLVSDGPKGSETFGSQTYGQFFSQVFEALGRPSTQGNLRAFAGIVNTEGRNAYFNPLNIEWHQGDPTAYQGAGSFNSVGVQEYTSIAAGVGATVAFIQAHWPTVNTALLSGSYNLVTAALTSTYTWAQFRPAGNGAQADVILAAPIGSS